MIAKYFHLYKFILTSRKYPYLRVWLVPYLRWLFNVKDKKRIDNDAIYHIIRFFNQERFGSIEASLQQAGRNLACDPHTLASTFKLFQEHDPKSSQKLGDLLAEINVVIALGDLGFMSIRKLNEAPPQKRIDFIAKKDHVWGVEVKNIRLRPEEYDFRMGVARGENEPTWTKSDEEFSEMRAKTALKIKYHSTEITEQFSSTASAEEFSESMLVFHTHDTIFLSEFPNELNLLLADLKILLPSISHVGIAQQTKLFIYP